MQGQNTERIGKPHVCRKKNCMNCRHLRETELHQREAEMPTRPAYEWPGKEAELIVEYGQSELEKKQ
jgi:hypothetical protein